MMKSSKRVVFLLLILAVANTTVYGVPYIKDTYYDLMMKTMSLSHAEMGVLCSAYGIVATFSYLLGGIVADKWSLRKQIMISLVIMGALDWMFSIKLSFKAGIIVMGLMGVFSILTFYPALIKLIFGLGVHCGQGKAFGIFNSGVNVVSLFFICLTVMIFNRAGQNPQVFYVIVRCYAIVNFIGAFGVWRYICYQYSEWVCWYLP